MNAKSCQCHRGYAVLYCWASLNALCRPSSINAQTITNGTSSVLTWQIAVGGQETCAVANGTILEYDGHVTAAKCLPMVNKVK